MLRRFLCLLLLCISLNGLTTAVAQDLPELQPITPENAAQIEQLAMLGMGGLGSVAWSPDGKTIEVSGSIGRWLLDSETLAPLRFIERYAPIGRVQIDLVITEDEDGSTQVSRFHAWDTANYTRLHLTEDHYGDWHQITLSPDGERLVGCFNRLDPFICDSLRGWDMETLLTEEHPSLVVVSVGNQPYPVSNFAFRPDSTLIAAGEDEDSLVVWNVDTGEQLLDINQTGISVTFSPDASQLVFFGDDAVHIWDIESQKERVVLQPFDNLLVYEATKEYAYIPTGWDYFFNQDNSRLVIAINQFWWWLDDNIQHNTGYIRVYDTDTGAEIVKITAENNQIVDVAFNADGTQIAVTKTSGISLYDVETGKELATLANSYDSFISLKFTPDETLLARSQFTFHNPSDQPLQQMFFSSLTAIPFDTAYPPEQRTMLVGGSTLPVENPVDQFVTEKVEAKLAEIEGVNWLDDAVYNSDRTLIAGARRGNSNESHSYWVSIYDAATSEVLAKIPHDGYVQNVLFDHDGKTLFSLSWDNTEKTGIIRQWNVAQAITEGELSNEDGEIIIEIKPVAQFTYTGTMVLNPDENILAVTAGRWNDGSYRAFVQLVDIKNHTLLTELELGGYILDDDVPHGSGITWDTTIQSIVFSQDSKLLVASGCEYNRDDCHRGSLYVWDIATGERLFAKSTHHNQVTVALNPDNTLLATGSYDGTIRLWGVPVEQGTP